MAIERPRSLVYLLIKNTLFSLLLLEGSRVGGLGQVGVSGCVSVYLAFLLPNELKVFLSDL